METELRVVDKVNKAKTAINPAKIDFTDAQNRPESSGQLGLDGFRLAYGPAGKRQETKITHGTIEVNNLEKKQKTIFNADGITIYSTTGSNKILINNDAISMQDSNGKEMVYIGGDGSLRLKNSLKFNSASDNYAYSDQYPGVTFYQPAGADSLNSIDFMASREGLSIPRFKVKDINRDGLLLVRKICQQSERKGVFILEALSGLVPSEVAKQDPYGTKIAKAGYSSGLVVCATPGVSPDDSRTIATFIPAVGVAIDIVFIFLINTFMLNFPQG